MTENKERLLAKLEAASQKFDNEDDLHLQLAFCMVLIGRKDGRTLFDEIVKEDAGALKEAGIDLKTLRKTLDKIAFDACTIRDHIAKAKLT